MNKPKMILFDYGYTLVHEISVDGVRGTEAVLKHAVRNERKLSAIEVSRFSNFLFEEMGKARRSGLEIHNHMLQRFLYEFLEIELPLTQDEIEDIFWDAFTLGEAMPNIGELLDYLNDHGIRTGVISNISFSEGALMRRLDRLLPNNRFEFVIATSEYIFRKPNAMIFELAVRKARLQPYEVWYCGDNPRIDVMGAAGAGLYPVWYRSGFECLCRDSEPDEAPECEHTEIFDWMQLIRLVNDMPIAI